MVLLIVYYNDKAVSHCMVEGYTLLLLQTSERTHWDVLFRVEANNTVNSQQLKL